MLTFAIVIFFLSTPIRGLTLTLHPLGNSIKMNNKKIGGFAFGLFFCVCVFAWQEQQEGFASAKLVQSTVFGDCYLQTKWKVSFFCGNYPVVNKVDPISESVTMRAAVNTVKS